MKIRLQEVRDAAKRIAPHVHRTAVLTSTSLDADSGGSLFFKCENFQNMGAFKARGAMNAVLQLDDATAVKGVATHSSGNHGAALARAAQIRGVGCTVVVPRGANASKLANIRRYGAEIIECEATQQSRESVLDEFVERSGARVVHPYADRDVMTGQGTVALELLEQVPDLDILLVPLGGGGLLAGCASVAAELSPDMKIIGVEPDGAADGLASFRSGEVTSVVPDTIADGLRATIGEPNLAIIREHVHDILTVSDADIVRAMRSVMERLKIVVEPSCVVGLAAVQAGLLDASGKRVGIVFTGGNVDFDKLPWSPSDDGND